MSGGYWFTKQSNGRPERELRREFLPSIATFRQPGNVRKPNRMSACILCGKLTKQGVCGTCWPKAQAMLEEARRNEAEQANQGETQ